MSTNALINLSQNGVNGDVINEMIKKVDKSNTSAVKKIDINNPNADSWFFATATSPNEFVLVKLYAYERKKYRNIQIGTTTIIGGSYSEKSGVREKDKVPFEYTEISEGIYKIIFREPLKPGEYCFMYSSATPAMYTNDKVWDFGISENE